MRHKIPFSLTLVLFTAAICLAQPRRKVIINEDCSGPGGSNIQTLLMMIQSPQVEVLGITVVSGDQWRDEEVAHTLRMLELIGRTDIPVVPGAAFPLLHTREEAQTRVRAGSDAGGPAPPWPRELRVDNRAAGEPHLADAPARCVVLEKRWPHWRCCSVAA